jgi:uncharacterized protein (DUF2235 family)
MLLICPESFNHTACFRMPKNLVLCCDGTCNEIESHETNVLRLYKSLVQSPAQVCYYSPGVGTLATPGALTVWGRKLRLLLGAGFGYGLTANVEDAYRFIVRHYQAGDRIFIFGFSRGAFTARVVAAMLRQCGLIPQHLENLLPYATKAFQASFGNFAPDNPAALFRQSFARDAGDFLQTGSIHFLGLWDTVTSVGTALSPVRWPNVTTNPAVGHVRHAISIQERRCFFRPNRWHRSAGQVVDEVWFRGVHADVGGGYDTADGLLWAAPLFWMTRGAREAGLLVDGAKLRAIRSEARSRSLVVRATPASQRHFLPSWEMPSHTSLTFWWKLAELLPRRHWERASDGKYHEHLLWQPWKARERTLRSGERLHRSVIWWLRRSLVCRCKLPATLAKAGIGPNAATTLRRDATGCYLVP